MYNDTFEFIYAVFGHLNRFGVEVRAEVEFEGVLEAVVHFDALERVVVEVEAVQVDRQHRGETVYLLALQRVGLLIAVVTEQFIIPIKLIELEQFAHALSDPFDPFDLYDEI